MQTYTVCIASNISINKIKTHKGLISTDLLKMISVITQPHDHCHEVTQYSKHKDAFCFGGNGLNW